MCTLWLWQGAYSPGLLVHASDFTHSPGTYILSRRHVKQRTISLERADSPTRKSAQSGTRMAGQRQTILSTQGDYSRAASYRRPAAQWRRVHSFRGFADQLFYYTRVRYPTNNRRISRAWKTFYCLR